MATEKEKKRLQLPEVKIKADPKSGKLSGIEAEVSKMGVLGTPGQLDMEAVKRMMEELERQGR